MYLTEKQLLGTIISQTLFVFEKVTIMSD